MLTPKKDLFCQEYIKVLNATAAAKAAGYSGRTAYSQGQRLLQETDVQERIRELQKEALMAAGVDLKDVVRQLASVAYTDLSEIVDLKAGELTVKDFELLTPAQRAALAEITYTPGKYGTTIRVKMHPKLVAADMLMKHLGGYVSINEIIDKMPPEKIEEVCQQLLSKLK